MKVSELGVCVAVPASRSILAHASEGILSLLSHDEGRKDAHAIVCRLVIARRLVCINVSQSSCLPTLRPGPGHAAFSRRRKGVQQNLRSATHDISKALSGYVRQRMEYYCDSASSG